MGDFSSSDSSWKKMVIAKANDEWISTIKAEHSDLDDDHSGNEQTGIRNVKRENVDGYIVSDDSEVMTQDADPLCLLRPGPSCTIAEIPQRRRRKGSASTSEDPYERSARLAKMSAYAAQRLANETPEQRATRLRRMSEYAAKRLAQETSEQRAKRLARMSAYAAKRLATETPEQRQLRLTRMSVYAARRHAQKKAHSSTSKDINSSFNLSNIMPNQS